MSILKWQVSSSSNFASFFIFMTHNSSVNFKLIHILLWTKGFHQSPNYETFQYSGENLPNSSCHFQKHHSDFLQILHHFSVSWNITPPYSNIIYVGQKEPIKFHKGNQSKCRFFETFEYWGQNSPNFCHF